MPEQIVIIGAGQAGVQVVQSLRGEGYAGAITMIVMKPIRPISGRLCPKPICWAASPASGCS